MYKAFKQIYFLNRDYLLNKAAGSATVSRV